MLGTEVNRNWRGARAGRGGTRNPPPMERVAGVGLDPLVTSSAVLQQWG